MNRMWDRIGACL